VFVPFAELFFKVFAVFVATLIASCTFFSPAPLALAADVSGVFAGGTMFARIESAPAILDNEMIPDLF